MPVKTDNSFRTLGDRGANLIKSFERLRLIAYMPTPNDRPTIGYGSTHNVSMGMVITPAEAETRFNTDTYEAVQYVRHTIQVPLTASMFDALVSLAFNIGVVIAQGSTIRTALLVGDYYAACQGFFLWRKQAGKDLLGLARRRVKEMELFLADGMPL